MRITLAVAVACFSLVAITTGKDAEAAMRRPTNIAAQGLAPALRILAKERDVQLVYRTELVGDHQTSGAAGDLTFEEALTQLLSGTGLTYRYLENNAVTIVPLPSASTSALSMRGEGVASEGSSGEDSTGSSQEDKETQSKSFWDRFRLAQVDQGKNSNSSPMSSSNSSSTESGSNKNPDSSSTKLEEVVVRGTYKFLSVDTSGTTNLPLAIEKVPQSISLVSGDFIKAANLKTLGEIAEYTPGAINAGDPASNGSVIMLRGFSAGRAVDGLPVNISNGTSYEPDYAIFDRLEVVKGPTSVVYGVSSPGGLVNSVTKSATPQTIDYLFAQVGSWKSYRLEGQISGSLDSAGRVRAIGIAVRDQGDSFMDIQRHAKTAVYGGVNVDLSDSVTAYLHGGYERFVRNGFDGMPTEPDGSPAPVARSFFIGAPDIETTSSVYHAEGDLTWHVTNLWELSVKGNYESGKNQGSSAYGYGLQENGDISLSAFNYQLPGTGTHFDNYAIGASSIYHLDSLGLKDSFVSLAALYQDSHTGFAGSSPPGSGTLTRNIFDGESVIGQALDSLIAAANVPYTSRHKDNTVSYSAQSVLKLTDPLTLLLGVAYSKPESKIISTGGVQDFNFDSQISYRAGITYEIIPRVNAYVSFSQSFSPQVYSSLDANGVSSPLPPLKGEQYETGLKYRSGDGRLLVTGALFQIKQKNQAQFQQFANGTNYFSPIGEVTHKGLELEAVGQITSRWQVNAGYAYLNPKVTKDSTPEIEGQTSLYLPQHTGSLYTTYALPGRMLHGLVLGGGIRYVSSVRTSYDNASANNAAGLSPTIELPSYSLLDVTASYVVNKWLLQLNARNVFDKHYFINNYQTLFFGNVVGQPANVTLTIRREF